MKKHKKLKISKKQDLFLKITLFSDLKWTLKRSENYQKKLLKRAN